MHEKKKKDTWLGVMFLLVIVLLIAIILLPTAGCGTINGLGTDTENIGRWTREATQPGVDNMELTRIESAINNQNRLMHRGQQMESALGR